MIGRLPSTRKMFKLNCKAIHIYREKGVPTTADTVHPNIMIFLTTLISDQGDLTRLSLSLLHRCGGDVIASFLLPPAWFREQRMAMAPQLGPMIERLPSTRKMFKLNCKAIHIYNLIGGNLKRIELTDMIKRQFKS